MKILGVTLHAPTSKEVVTAFTRHGLVLLVIAVLVQYQHLSADSAVAILTGAAGAVLASACGCSVQSNGLRALPVIAIFAVTMWFICRVIFGL